MNFANTKLIYKDDSNMEKLQTRYYKRWIETVQKFLYKVLCDFEHPGVTSVAFAWIVSQIQTTVQGKI